MGLCLWNWGRLELEMLSMIEHLWQGLPDWRQYALLYVLVAGGVGFVMGRYSAHRAGSFQNSGEALLARAVLKNFRPPEHHLMNHVTLQMKDGTTQIDHILVSRFGVFVIETKDYKGWIFGNANQAVWTQVLFNAKFKFQNPVQQNFRHVSAVRDLLDFLPPDAVKSVVVFTGEAEFKTEVPQGVFSSLAGCIEYLRQQTVEVMSINRVQFCVGRLETARLAVSGKTDVEHVESLARRYGRNS
jgi:hypothetical protein